MGGCNSSKILKIDLQSNYIMIPINQNRYEYGILYRNLNPPNDYITVF